MVQVCYKLLILLYLDYKRVACDAAGRVVSRVGMDSDAGYKRGATASYTDTGSISSSVVASWKELLKTNFNFLSHRQCT